MARIYLVTGGARSGKSSYALALAESFPGKRLFIATCPVTDKEMAERIERHRQERVGRGWDCLEAPVDLEKAMKQSAAHYNVILLDCITLWINNLLFESQEKEDTIDDDHIRQLCNRWVTSLMDADLDCICVTNEVGLGIVPENRLARKYRDLVGTANQFLGGIATQVTLVSCGQPLYLKPRQEV